MSRGLLSQGAFWRIGLLIALYAVPVLVFMGFGLYYLNSVVGDTMPWVPWVSWGGMFACFLAAALLGAWFTRKGSTAIFNSPTYDDPLNYWTDRDQQAWRVVEAHAATLKPISLDDLNNPTALMPLYTKEAEALVRQVGQVYKPGSADPLSHVTIPEILTCVELVVTDLSVMVDRYVPGSSFVTLGHLKMARKAADHYRTASNIYWVVSAALNPLKTIAQYAGSQLGLQPGMSQIQNNVLHWFFLTFVHQFGRYLIELNSGRLKVGAKRYRELMARHQAPPAAAGPAPVPPQGAAGDPDGETRLDLHRVTVSVVGPVKAGKSSLINALFGETKTAVAPVPLTASSTRYDLDTAGLPPLSVMDTVGFGVNGPTDADIANAMSASREADVLVLALPARSAARAPEVQFLDRLRAAFLAQPQLKMPPVVVALTHIDQLTPAMEWAPPYDWKAGAKTKEKSIREAVAAVRELFGAKVAEVVPVCALTGKEYGVRDALVTEMARHLDDARGVGLLRALHLEGLIDHTKKAFGQAINAGKEILRQVFKTK